MALIPSSKFPGRSVAPDANYPQGSAQNITSPGDNTGTPWVADLINDIWGFFQSVFLNADITPSGVPDNATASDVLDGLETLNLRRAAQLSIRNWTLSGAAPEANGWIAVAWSPELGLFAAVSIDGTNRVMTSFDGLNWISRSTPAVGWADIIWIPQLSRFVALTNSSVSTVNAAMVSTDGVTWTGYNTSQTGQWQELTYSPTLGIILAVSNDGKLITSSDGGETWANGTSPAGTGYTAVDWSEELGLFVAVKAIGANRISTSPDGVTWTPYSFDLVQWTCVRWVQYLGLFVAGGQSGPYSVITSPDGVTWTPGTFTGALNDIVVVNKARQIVGVATNGTVKASTDAVNWSPIVSPEANAWISVEWSNELCMAVAVSGSGTNRIIRTL